MGAQQNESLSSGGSPTIGSVSVNPSFLGKGNPPAFDVQAGTTATVQVDNVQSGASVTFFITQGSGAEQVLGTVIPQGSVASITWQIPAQIGMPYIMRAEALNSQGLTARSKPITVLPGIADGGQGGQGFAAPTTSAPDCPGAPPAQLVVGGRGQVTPGDPNRLRNAPSTWQGSVVGQMPAGSVFNVIGGPQCSDNLRFWQVSYNGLSAWTADGTGSTYWVQPVP
jgi:hypothetical protein